LNRKIHVGTDALVRAGEGTRPYVGSLITIPLSTVVYNPIFQNV
jgi:hypothetical protein